MKHIKEKVKKYKFLYKILSKIKNEVTYKISCISPKFLSKYKYRMVFKKQLNLKNPKRLTEKLMWLKLNKYWNEQIIADRADKYEVRKHIEKLLGNNDILIGLCGVWNRVEEIEWDILPNKFVIKCNHGSGYNIICKNKLTFDIEEAKSKLNKWLKEDYGYSTAEQGIYKKIKKRIIVEEFIETEDKLPPKDYKFFCTYGKVKLLFVASERVDDKTKFDYYTPEWEWIPVKNCHPNAGPTKKPKNLEKMIDYAEQLSKEFPIVRVDLYNEGEKIYFGELTFTHFGCLNGFDPDRYDEIFGSYFPSREEMEKWNSKY